MEWTFDHQAKKVTAMVSRTIEEGGRYRINSSYGYEGITSGAVQVHLILDVDGIRELEKSDDSEDNLIARNIAFHTEQMLGLFEEGTEDWQQQLEYLTYSPWVVYYYPNHETEQGQWHVFPVEDFIYHTTMLP